MNIGDRFDSKEEVKLKCNKFAYENNFYFTFGRFDNHCIYADCALPGCKYQIRFFKSNDPRPGHELERNYKLTKFMEPHSCDCSDLSKEHRKIDYSPFKEQLQNLVINDMNVGIDILSAIIEEKTGVSPSYRQVWDIRQGIIDNYIYNFKKCFKFIFSFICYLNTIGGYGIYENNEDNTFRRAFVGLPYSRRIIFYMRKFISLDGAHIKNIIKDTLLVAVGLDPNNNIIILAYAIVPIEDGDNWNWFLMHLRTLLGYTSYSEFVFISDRDKGLSNGLKINFPESVTTVCLRHLMANIRKKIKNKELLATFYKSALTFNDVKFSQYLEILKGNNELYDMIKDIIPQWARSQINFPRFGQSTSNISESINAAIRKSRKYSDLDLMLYIYNYICDKFEERRAITANITNTFTPYCNALLEINMNMTDQYLVSNKKEFEAVITHKRRKEDGREKSYYVNLSDNYCSCGHFRDNLIPCLHAGKLISTNGLNSSNYISDFYKVEVHQYIYSYSLTPILKSQLFDDGVTLCPRITQKKGRPKSTKRKKSFIEQFSKKRKY